MRQILRERFSVLLIPLVIALVFSLFTLILINSSIKYFLFIFEILAIFVSILLFVRNRSNTGEWTDNRSFSKMICYRVYSEFIPGLGLIGISALLLFFQLYEIEGGIVQLFFAMATGCFLVGYNTLNATTVRKHFSRLEYYILSFLTSIGLTGFLSIALDSFGSLELGLSLSFIVIGIISLLSSLVRDKPIQREPPSFFNSMDMVAIIVCLIFYLGYASLMYPNAASLIATDISRHISYSVTLFRTPDLYSTTYYLLFHSFQGGIFLLSGENQSIIMFLSSFAFLNIFLPLSMYVATKRLLGTLDSRIPPLAVICYTFLSNMSFIYFTALKLSTPETEVNVYPLIVREVAEQSYFTIINVLQPFNFLVPLTISLVGMIILLSLMRNASLSKYKFFGLFTFLVVTCALIHLPEIAIFGLLISVFSIVNSKAFVRTKEALMATACGFTIAAIVLAFVGIFILQSDDMLSGNVPVMAFIVSAIPSVAALSWNYSKTKPKIVPAKFFTYLASKIEFVIAAIVVLYLGGIILWFFMQDLQTSSIIGIGVVPTFLYPVILGVVGLMSIFSMRKLSDKQHRGVILFLLLSVFLLFVIGKILSFVNTSLFEIPYWEKRMLPLIFIFTSMLAPIAITASIDTIRSRLRNTVLWTLIISTILASIFLIGFSSLATQTEYWYVRANGEQRLSVADIDAIEALRGMIDNKRSLVTVAPSEFSRHALSFTASSYQLDRQDILFSSKLPEVPLMILGGLKYDQVYVYIHDRDLEILNTYSDSWFTKHLLPTLPVLYQNEEVKVYNASGLKFPQSSSQIALTVPMAAISDNWLYVYNSVAKASKNYTEVLDRERLSDGGLKNTIFTSDPLSTFLVDLDFTSENGSHFFWNTVGEWEKRDDGLHLFGNYSNPLEGNLLLSDFTSDSNNITVTTQFKIDDRALNWKIPTHVRLVSSWEDPRNYDLAGIALDDDNIYAYFVTVKDSKATFYPQFPYRAPLITGLKWDGDSLINMTVSKNGNVETLYINGKKYLSRNLVENPNGFIGISTFGSNNIIFNELRVSAEACSTIPYSEYFEYMKNGGNLFVYNTNGYGHIFNLLTNLLNNEHRYPIKEHGTLDKTVPHSVGDCVTMQSERDPTSAGSDSAIAHNISKEVIKDSNGNYTVINAQLPEGSLRYFDVYPLINNRSLSENEKHLLLKNSTDRLLDKDYNQTDFDFREIPMIFQNIGAQGDIRIDTDSVIFATPLNARLVNLSFGHTFEGVPVQANLTSLEVGDYNKTSFHSSNITLDRSGGGMYPRISLEKGQTIKLEFDRNASIRAVTLNGSQISFENVTSIVLANHQPINILVRTPRVSVLGNTQFENLYAGRLTGIAGEDAIFKGNISFAVLASDTYTMVDDVLLDGKFDKTLQTYNEIHELITAGFAPNLSLPTIVLILLAIPFILAGILFFNKGLSR